MNLFFSPSRSQFWVRFTQPPLHVHVVGKTKRKEERTSNIATNRSLFSITPLLHICVFPNQSVVCVSARSCFVHRSTGPNLLLPNQFSPLLCRYLTCLGAFIIVSFFSFFFFFHSYLSFLLLNSDFNPTSNYSCFLYIIPCLFIFCIYEIAQKHFTLLHHHFSFFS